VALKRSRLRLAPKEYKKLCTEVFERDGWKCKSCKRRSNLHAHHIKFRSHGGDDASYNLVTLCSMCHDALHERYLLLRDKLTGSTKNISANTGVIVEYINGWIPKKTTRS
jgi:5-methylcytosine-specific restriction endonuclease McrA